MLGAPTNLSRIICHPVVCWHQKNGWKKVEKNLKFPKTKDMSNIGFNWGYSQNFMTVVPKMRSGGSIIQNSPIFIRSRTDDALNHIVEQFYNPHMTSYAWIFKKNDQFKLFCKILDQKIFLVHFRQGGSAVPPGWPKGSENPDLKGLT